jgi:hypothetical protein
MSSRSHPSYSDVATVAISAKSYRGKSVHLSVVKKALQDMYGLPTVHRLALKKALAGLVARNVLVQDAQMYKLAPASRAAIKKKTSKASKPSPKASQRKASDNQGRKPARKGKAGKRASLK